MTGDKKYHAEKYQAEVFRLGGYCLCTPLCMKACSVLVKFTTFGELCNGILTWQSLVLLLLLARIGLTLINKGYIIMRGVDEDA